MLLVKELIEELNKLPQDSIIKFGIFDGKGENVEFLDLGRVMDRYIQPVRNGLVTSDPIVSHVITLAPMQKDR